MHRHPLPHAHQSVPGAPRPTRRSRRPGVPARRQAPAAVVGHLKAYPVLSEGGWHRVVKCQACLHSVSREPWTRLGPIELLADTI